MRRSTWRWSDARPRRLALALNRGRALLLARLFSIRLLAVQILRLAPTVGTDAERKSRWCKIQEFCTSESFGARLP
jgi:hypothetical protein